MMLLVNLAVRAQKRGKSRIETQNMQRISRFRNDRRF
jgi:hypothetical protein